MDSNCLCVVPILRCTGLSNLEASILLIPPFLESIFSIGLAFDRNSGATDIGW